MFHIFFPAMHFFIALALVMILVGILQRSDENKLRTVYLAFLLLCAWMLAQAIGYLTRGGYIPTSERPYVMAVYFLVPFLILYFYSRKTLYHASVYSIIILASVFISGALMNFFIRELLDLAVPADSLYTNVISMVFANDLLA